MQRRLSLRKGERVKWRFNSNLWQIREGKCSWQAPSNIALVKYWGKYGEQLPANASISLTLSQATTTTTLQWQYDPQRQLPEVIFYFDNKLNEKFATRVNRVIARYQQDFPLLQHFKLVFHSENTFAHSAGIASSASGMAALALTIATMLREFTTGMSDEQFFFDVSSLARLASGSASRSIFAPVVSWGEHSLLNSDQEHAAIVENVAPVFKSYCDDIIMVSNQEKSVSSSAGHALMNEHFYREIRFKQAQHNCQRLVDVLASGDLEKFVSIVEEEALSLHSLMMTSNPSFILMRPATLAIIEQVRKFRQQQGVPICFTLDAGPNVHLLYPQEYRPLITTFIHEQLLELTDSETYLADQVGHGPKQLI